jgi:diguanylate cyclase (GGDEF)-like protein/PAS domain S-box-containing protein
VTPTLAQRVGLDRTEFPADVRRTLLAARTAAISFLALATFVFVASAAGGDLGASAILGGGAAATCAVLLIVAYERMPRFVNRLLSGAAMVIVAQLTFFQPAGELYAALYLGVVIYVSFFFSRAQSLGYVFAAVALWGIALFQVHAVDDAVQAWVLGAGTLAAVASVTRSMRDRLFRTLQRAHDHQATLDAFFQHAPAGFAVLDAELRHVRVNQALADIMGHEPDAMEGRTLRELAPVDADVLEPLALSVLASGDPVLGIEIENADGHCHLVSYYPVPGANGTVGVGTAVTDVTHLKAVERSLEETNRKLTVLATTDELTQLPNRRMFGEQLDLALARARRGGLAVALLCVDLDRFKEVNDTLGHAYGDRMLVQVAGLLRTGARDTDVVARVGGDEFFVMLADLDVQAAPELAATVVERIRDLLAAPIPVDVVEINADACIGVAIYPTDSRDADGLVAAADAAMYARKRALARVA